MIPLPDKKYSIIYADPPWGYQNKGTRAAASKHYGVMTVEDIKKMGVGSHEVGEPCTNAGQSWRCCQAHNCNDNPDIKPGESPAHWAPYHTTDPARAKPFIQPTGAHDAYLKGEVCLWTDGKVYRSTMETANAYSPADYPQGWQEIEGGAST